MPPITLNAVLQDLSQNSGLLVIYLGVLLIILGLIFILEK